MATVSGAALPNSSFPVIGLGASASVRPPPIRDTSGTVGAGITGRSANQNQSTTGRSTGSSSSAVEIQNGVRPGGANGALLDLSTTIGAQEASQGEDDTDAGGLTEAEREQVAKLRQADAEVRRHESAHAAVGGAFAGAPSFTFERGPDGQQYAVAGEVSIDTSPVDGDPAATIRKLQTVQRAALAPADPSGQDRAVAAQANAAIRQAQAELQSQRAEELTGEDETSETDGVTETGADPESAPSDLPQIGANREADAAPEAAARPAFSFSGRPQGQDDGFTRAAAATARIIDIAV